MKLFQFTTTLFLFLSICLGSQADIGDILFSDIRAHNSDYLSLYMEGRLSIPPEMASYFMAVRTYPGDSFTSLLSGFTTDADMMSVVENLPWYSSRLESAISVAITEIQETEPPQLTVTSTSAIRTQTTTSILNLLNSTYSITGTPPLNLQVPTYAYNNTLFLKTSAYSQTTSNNNAHGAFISSNLIGLGFLIILLL